MSKSLWHDSCMTFVVAIRENIKRLVAEKAEGNQSEAARHSKVPQRTIGRIMNGEVSPTVDVIYRLATSYGYEAWQLFGAWIRSQETAPHCNCQRHRSKSHRKTTASSRRNRSLQILQVAPSKKFYPRQDTNVLTVRRSCLIMILTQHIAANESPTLHMSWRKARVGDNQEANDDSV